MSLWTADALRAATGGSLAGAAPVTGVSIDTRSLAPGDLFVALRDVRDGHEFVADALAAGAAAAMVDRDLPELPPDAPLLHKPFQNDQLLMAMSQLLDRSRPLG